MYQKILFICLVFLSSEVYPQYYVSWSLDGTQLAFNNDDGIYVADRDGSSLRRLTDVSSPPSWLPDGRVIFSGEGGIYSIYPDGSQRTFSFKDAISVSPDGQKVLFQRSTGEFTYVLEVGNSDGSGEKSVLFGKSDTDNIFSSFVWSPDSNKMAFRIAHSQGYSSPIFLTLLPGNDGLTTNDTGYGFSWAPDSKRIAFENVEGISAIDIDTRKEELLVEDAAAPFWSPDGRYIAFSRRDSASHWGIYTKNLESNTQKRLTTDLHQAFSPTWSPDGALIAYMTDLSGGIGGIPVHVGIQVHVIDIEGGHHITAVEGRSWGEIKSQVHK